MCLCCISVSGTCFTQLSLLNVVLLITTSKDFKLSVSWLRNLLRTPVNSFLKAVLLSLFRFKTPCKLSWLKLTDLFTYLHIYLLTYLLTQWSRVLLEKLTGFQLVKKFPAVYGTRRFITAFTSARHLSLSWANSIHSIHSHPTSWTSILILYSHLRLGLPSGTYAQIYIKHLSHSSTAPSGPEPLHYRCFTITLRHTTVGRTPLDEWSARRTDLYMHNTQHKQETEIHDLGGIWTRNPGKRAAED